MYIPEHYAVTNRSKIIEFITHNGFGILCSYSGTEQMASHLPFVIDKDRGEQGLILGHMARANSQWKHADGQQVLAIFHGAHAYVSPSWYQEEDTVPTWNYVAVHATGLFKAVEDRTAIEEIVERITDYYESSQPQPWQADFSTAYADQMIKRIVAFEITITRLEGKWKLNQNHPEGRRRRVAEQLTLGSEYDQQIAGLMQQDFLS